MNNAASPGRYEPAKACYKNYVGGDDYLLAFSASEATTSSAVVGTALSFNFGGLFQDSPYFIGASFKHREASDFPPGRSDSRPAPKRRISS